MNLTNTVTLIAWSKELPKESVDTDGANLVQMKKP